MMWRMPLQEDACCGSPSAHGLCWHEQAFGMTVCGMTVEAMLPTTGRVGSAHPVGLPVLRDPPPPSCLASMHAIVSERACCACGLPRTTPVALSSSLLSSVDAHCARMLLVYAVLHSAVLPGSITRH